MGWELVGSFMWILSVSIDFLHYLNTEIDVVLIVQVLCVHAMLRLDLIFQLQNCVNCCYMEHR